MVVTTDYCYAEPEQKTVFVDSTGKNHPDRETAIAANIFQDVKDHVNENGKSNPVVFADDLFQIAKSKPQMIRDFLDCFE